MDAIASPTELRNAFGQAVREFRKAQGFSQERLAEHAGLHRTYIGGVERGLRNVSLVNIFRLANALAVDAATLMSRAQDELVGR